MALPIPDLLYADIPDSCTDMWWPAVFACAERLRPCWLLVEWSPTVRCERIVRDLAVAGWAFRIFHLTVGIECAGLLPEEWDSRRRGVVIASRDPSVIDAIPLVSMSAVLEVSGLVTDALRHSPEWHEVSRGLRSGWTCICEQVPCACDQEARVRAVQDACSPFATEWWAEMLSGVSQAAEVA